MIQGEGAVGSSSAAAAPPLVSTEFKRKQEEEMTFRSCVVNDNIYGL
ncbi:hypothetical protein BS78_09G100900 [Paspalum vaginatum]|nr:hypothetical protein BS78_09G100900 [Paspalum vaginatum]